VLSVFNMGCVFVANVVAGSTGPMIEVLVLMDTLLTPVFVVDFLYRLLTASSRTGYFLHGWGWADLLATVPMFRIFRVFRILRVARLLREYGARSFIRDLGKARASSTFLITMFMVIVVVELAAATIYYAERAGPEANIQSAGDSVWWALVTITTVGYGDRFPTTLAGRMIGTFLLFAGIGLFSVLTGFIANTFLAPASEPESEAAPLAADGDPRATIDAVRELLREQEERSDRIRRHLEALERTMPPVVS
jgi:voltage-gated potassium channel